MENKAEIKRKKNNENAETEEAGKRFTNGHEEAMEGGGRRRRASESETKALSARNRNRNSLQENFSKDLHNDLRSKQQTKSNDTNKFENGVSKKESRKDRRSKDKRDKKDKKKPAEWYCSYCTVSFADRDEFSHHCSSQKHQRAVVSDDGGRNWRFRPPPRGVGSDTYRLCRNIAIDGVCRFGIQCVDAHSNEELSEWKERFEFRQKKVFKASKIFGKSFVDTVVEKLNNSSNPNAILRNNIDGVFCSCDRDLSVTIANNREPFEWTFRIRTDSIMLRNIALLSDENRIHFTVASVKHQGIGDTKEVLKTYNADHQQEWAHPELSFFSSCREMEYLVKVRFSTDFFGSFSQTIVFNFGSDPVLLKRDLRVDVTPAADEDSASASSSPSSSDTDEAKTLEIIIKQPERWDKTNAEMVDFDPPINVPEPKNEALFRTYPPPNPSKFKMSQNLRDPRLTKANYRGRMHELLFLEEIAQYEHVSQFNIVTKLKLTASYYLTAMGSTSSSAKYARPGELYGKMTLSSNLSEDTSAGRLILTNCSSLLLSKPGFKRENEGDKRLTFVAVIEDSGKNTLYTRLSKEFVSHFALKDDDQLEVEVQFQLNRLPICEMHNAVDKLPDLELVYPDINRKISIPWNTGKLWTDEFDKKLNAKQKEAVLAITADRDLILPPVLIIGPYGTGKTFTLGQSLKMLLKEGDDNRILVCTHSNSAADLYIRDYIDPYVMEGGSCKAVRVYYENRWVKTVHETVLKYCLINRTEHARTFRYPTSEDVLDCKIVVATLSTTKCLTGLDLPKDHFTHILIDEAAQAMECEAIMALALASIKTRIVLAGDHMQLSPEVFSKPALERDFNKSLLERLYDFYTPTNFPCKILLCQNYRSHEAIISYTSKLFYDRKLVASAEQSRHSLWYPLTLFTARGEDIQDMNSTSFYNNAEVYEIVERIIQLQSTWPSQWGRRDESSIGIVTPYYDQVQRIRSELRKRNLFGVSVERVLNVQGKQFRAVFLSTVRTRKLCVSGQEDPEIDFGFLSNAKLLNTAITRARSLVAVVGDPVALCSIGRCRKMWEKFVDICHKHDSFFGLTYQALRVMLDNVEFRKTYVLNPFAPEFVPRAAVRQQQPPPLRNNNNRSRANNPFNNFVLPVPPQQSPPWMKFAPPPPPPPPSLPPPPHLVVNPGWNALGGIKKALIPQPPPLQGNNQQAKWSNGFLLRKPIDPLQQVNGRRGGLLPTPLLVPPPTRPSDFMFLKDGVHFPKPPSDDLDELSRIALQLLPENVDFASFFKSEELQMAWFNYLRMNGKLKEAECFKNFIVYLTMNPEAAHHLHKRLVSRKIEASDLEAQMMRESFFNDNQRPLLPPQQPRLPVRPPEYRRPDNGPYREWSACEDSDRQNVILSEIFGGDDPFESAAKFVRSEPADAGVPLYLRRPEEPDEFLSSSLERSILNLAMDEEQRPEKPPTYANVLQRNPDKDESELRHIRGLESLMEDDHPPTGNEFRLFERPCQKW